MLNAFVRARAFLRACAVSVVCSAGLTASSASAGVLVVDDFSQGPMSITSAGNGFGTDQWAWGEQEVNVLGGFRSVVVVTHPYSTPLTTGTVTPSTGELSITGGSGYVSLSYGRRVYSWGLGDDANRAMNLDLTGYDRLRVHVTGNVPWAIDAVLYTRGGGWTTIERRYAPWLPTTGPLSGTVDFMFSDFVGSNFNLADVDMVSINLYRMSASGGTSRFDKLEFVAIPEPTSLACLAPLAAAALLRRRASAR